MGDIFSTGSFVALEKGLDTAALRQQVIANNVANINTPRFKKQEVSFENEFESAIAENQRPGILRTEKGHLSGVGSLDDVAAKVTTVKGTSMRYDGNNVDIDEEMSKLAENNIRYQAMSKLMSGRFGTLKSVINGGR